MQLFCIGAFSVWGRRFREAVTFMNPVPKISGFSGIIRSFGTSEVVGQYFSEIYTPKYTFFVSVIFSIGALVFEKKWIL
jgi:hypothetical protein